MAVSSVSIYETNQGGFVTQVELIDANGNSTIVYTGPDGTPCGSALVVALALLSTQAYNPFIYFIF